MAGGGLARVGEVGFIAAEDVGCFAAEDGVVVVRANDGGYAVGCWC